MCESPAAMGSDGGSMLSPATGEPLEEATLRHLLGWRNEEARSGEGQRERRKEKMRIQPLTSAKERS